MLLASWLASFRTGVSRFNGVSRKSRRKVVLPNSTAVEALEDRTLLAANLGITDVSLRDGMGNRITSPGVGERVVVQVNYTTQELAPDVQYNIDFRVDGQSVSSIPLSLGAGTLNSTEFWTETGWYATPGTHSVTVTLDANDDVPMESSDLDNVGGLTFTSVAVSPPQLFEFPVAGTPFVDYTIRSYVDLSPAKGLAIDYAGGLHSTDGARGIDISLGSFARMDQGVDVVAVADGTVIAVQDGNFDRNVIVNGTVTPGGPENYVIIDHGNGWQTEYRHLRANSIPLTVGQQVSAGDALGLVGSSGDSGEPQLRFIVRHNGSQVETFLAPDSFWTSPLNYVGAAPMLMDAGITNYNAFATPTDHRGERPSDISSVDRSNGQTIYAWGQFSGVRSGDQFRVEWIRPDGSLDLRSSVQITQNLAVSTFSVQRLLPFNPDVGTWRAVYFVNSTQVGEVTFDVAVVGTSEIRVEGASNNIILDGRTTPINFGTVNLGSNANATSRTFTVVNHGTSTLSLDSMVTVPTGFRLTTPLPATIARGSSATFTVQLDTTVAGTYTGQVRIRNNDFDEADYNFTVKGTIVDPTAPRIDIGIAERTINEGQQSIASISRTGSTAQPLIVTLSTNDVTEVRLPPSVTIPAGQSSVLFNIEGVNDGTTDGLQSARIIAQAAGYTRAINGIDIFDNGALTVTILADAINENSTTAVRGVVTRTSDTFGLLEVVLTSDDPSELFVQPSVTIPAGQTSASFDIFAVDDDILDGTNLVTITANSAGHAPSSDSIDVRDHETLTVQISNNLISESGGTGATTGTVIRGDVDDVSQALEVFLTSSDTTEAVVPTSIIIPSGSTSATFNIDAVDDDIFDGTQAVAITPLAPNYVSVPGTVNVYNDESVIVTETNDGADLTPGDGVVNTPSGQITLRSAIQDANALPGDDIVRLASGTFRLSLQGVDEDAAATGDLDILENLTIIGAGRGRTIIDAGGIDRVLHLFPNVTLNLSELTISGGITSGSGGGIWNEAGAISLTNVNISGNTAALDGGGIANGDGSLSIVNGFFSTNFAQTGSGGAINNNTGTLLVNSSTLANNTAAVNGGAINVGSGVLTMTNSTISTNFAQNGGGIQFFDSQGTGLATIVNATITRNSADQGGGISGFGTALLRNTIVADNSAFISNPDVAGVFSSQGNNLIGIRGTATGFVNQVNADQVGSTAAPIDPRLDLLRENGGPTLTHALRPGSPAIDFGSNVNSPAFDQRGTPRPQDGDNNSTSTTDIGAFEFTSSSIHGQKYGDFNANGIRDDDEIGLNGWIIELYRYDDTAPGVLTFVTSVDTIAIDVNRNGVIEPATEFGLYTFTDLPAGAYVVQEVLQAGWQQTAPTTDSISVTVNFDNSGDETGITLLNTTDFAFRSSNWTGGTVSSAGAAALFHSGNTSYQIGSTGGEVTFDVPVDSVELFFVHGFGQPTAKATAYDQAGNIIGTINSRISTVRGDNGNIQSIDPAAAIARIAFTGGSVDSFNYNLDVELGTHLIDVGLSQRIENVDFGNFVPISAVPTPIGPTGSTTDVTPTFSWQSALGAASYDLMVDNLSTATPGVINRQGIVGTSFTSNTPLLGGDYQFRVRGVNLNGTLGEWSDPQVFTIDTGLPVPGQPVLTAPFGTISDDTPEIRWAAAHNAATYFLTIDNLTTGEVRVVAQSGITATSLTITTPLPAGVYQAQVQAINAAGQRGSASAPATFTIVSDVPVPARPTVTGPPTTTTNLRPTFSWDADENAATFDLWVDNLTTGQEQVIRQTQLTDTVFTPDTSLPLGNYRVWVQARNSEGERSTWSESHAFTISLSTGGQLPSRPTLTDPVGVTFDATPTFSWSATTNTVTYDLWVDNQTTGEEQVIRQQTLTSNSFTPTADLPLGNYRAWVRAINSAGDAGSWSQPTNFTVDKQIITAPRPGQPELVDPSGFTDDTTPTFNWTSVANADHYLLRVNNLTTGVTDVIRQTDLTSTTFTPTSALAEGTYQASVQAFNIANQPGSDSTPIVFTISKDAANQALAPPRLTGPGSLTSDTTPTITWNAVGGAVRYDLWVNNLTTKASQVIRQQNLTTNSFTRVTALSEGTYRVWVRAFDSLGRASAWSARLDFTIDTSTLARPSLSAPTGTVGAKPTFTWNAIAGAETYDLWVRNLSTGEDQVIRQTVTTTTFTALNELAPGKYRAWVQALNSSNEFSRWSAQRDFTVGVPAAPPAGVDAIFTDFAGLLD